MDQKTTLSRTIQRIASVLDMEVSAVEAYAKVLRKDGHISTGGRGTGAPVITAGECAAIVMAILGGSVKMSTNTFKYYSEHVVVSPQIVEQKSRSIKNDIGFNIDKTLHDFIVSVMIDLDISINVEIMESIYDYEYMRNNIKTTNRDDSKLLDDLLDRIALSNERDSYENFGSVRGWLYFGQNDAGRLSNRVAWCEFFFGKEESMRLQFDSKDFIGRANKHTPSPIMTWNQISLFTLTRIGEIFR